MNRRILFILGLGLALLMFGLLVPRASAQTFPTPIQHVVIFYQENHSFDNVLGLICHSRPTPCDGATTGHVGNTTIPLSQASDVVPQVVHDTPSQLAGIDNGKMDGFYQISGCGATTHYACYSQYSASQIPNEAALANTFAVSDRTFEWNVVPSFEAHIDLVANTPDGFYDNPTQRTNTGWGCDSGLTARWRPTNTGTFKLEPTCVPAPKTSPGYAAEPKAVKNSPVSWVPTIMDRFDTAGVTWRIYAAAKGNGGYGWSTCPIFADCLYTGQKANAVETGQIITDAQAGTLPSLSILLPHSGATGSTSQHNGDSMAAGDNWIGQVISALEHGPEWSSTAVLLTFDDCGCFYDHVPPPTGNGIRVPMTLISPYARPGYTDSQPASFASMLAFVEHVFNVTPLNNGDSQAYDYFGAFNWSQPPLTGARMAQIPEPASSKAYIAAHPTPSDAT
jgi:phospholipase C